ncbi:MAG: type II toxin-antitoxin system PemK/MazF family toxin [Candidatus Marinimicrobia bacterium]|nr:type II toxin-antitoxin system PemK/MazF family toxin [Candidatus Neomarinimicrobiota bacterium]
MVTEAIKIIRGDVVLIRPDTVVGSEQRGVRPAIVVQNNDGNELSPVTVVIPLTDAQGKTKYPFTALVKQGDGGIRKDSFALANQIRVIDKQRIIEHWGHLSDDAIIEIDAALRDELSL